MSAPRNSTVAFLDPAIPEGDGFPSYLDLIAFSQLRWNFVWQRPHHLMSRWANTRRVFFIEEPIFGGPETFADVSTQDGVYVVVPHFADGVENYNEQMKEMLNGVLKQYEINTYICWYWTPMALQYTRHLSPQLTIYDCMDELSAFANAPSSLRQFEKELLAIVDLVFTGGQSLYEARRYQHPNIHPFPSSIDAPHFNQARFIKEEPADQNQIPQPRLGFFGVIDERMDLELLAGIAQARSDWHLVMLGPVVNINPDTLPKFPNIHYLGQKRYQDLPAYLAGWQVALLPFARNDSTRYISPTKTPEYLAAGRPVVSTSIRDVVRPYGEMKLIHIADTVDESITGIESAMLELHDKRWLVRVDAFLEGTSWDRTWSRMNHLIYQTLQSKRLADDRSRQPYFNTTIFESFPSVEGGD